MAFRAFATARFIMSRMFDSRVDIFWLRDRDFTSQTHNSNITFYLVNLRGGGSAFYARKFSRKYPNDCFSKITFFLGLLLSRIQTAYQLMIFLTMFYRHLEGLVCPSNNAMIEKGQKIQFEFLETHSEYMFHINLFWDKKFSKPGHFWFFEGRVLNVLDFNCLLKNANQSHG